MITNLVDFRVDSIAGLLVYLEDYLDC